MTHSAESGLPALTPEQRELLGSADARMQGYYIGFDKTGVVEIDRILSALAWAGKAYHHTEGWNDELDWDYGPIPKGTTCSDLIQRAANDAAATIERHKDALFERGERWKARTEKAEGTCSHGWPENACPGCAACRACDGSCGTCPYVTSPEQSQP